MVKRYSGGKQLRLIEADITKVETVAICNAANSGLRGGGGVDGAIHRAGGPSIMAELREIREKIGSCPSGSAVATGAGNLPAKYVFHAVGPVYRDGAHGEAELLESAYNACMDLAAERGVERISFPSISTGIYGYPVEDAAAIALATVGRRLESGTPVREATFVLFDRATFTAYERALTGGRLG